MSTRRTRRTHEKYRLFALSCLCISALAACGLQIGNGPYVGPQNVGPHSRSAQSEDQSRGAPAAYASPQDSTGVIELARRQIGIPYRRGGAAPKQGFDCSGLIFWVYRQNGVSVPRVAKAQSGYGDPVHQSLLRPGDIVAFRINGGYHTGIYSGNGYFIHSPSRGGKVREESMDSGYWQRHYVGARRVL